MIKTYLHVYQWSSLNKLNLLFLEWCESNVFCDADAEKRLYKVDDDGVISNMSSGVCAQIILV